MRWLACSLLCGGKWVVELTHERGDWQSVHPTGRLICYRCGRKFKAGITTRIFVTELGTGKPKAHDFVQRLAAGGAFCLSCRQSKRALASCGGLWTCYGEER